jgi:hypothetical protein
MLLCKLDTAFLSTLWIAVRVGEKPLIICKTADSQISEMSTLLVPFIIAEFIVFVTSSSADL